MRSHLPALDDFRRIVVKVGSSLLVDHNRSRIKHEWLGAPVGDISHLDTCVHHSVCGWRRLPTILRPCIDQDATCWWYPPARLRLDLQCCEWSRGRFAWKTVR